MLRIRDVYPGFRTQIFSILDPGSASKILTQKLSKILSGLFIPDPDPDFFTHPGSRRQEDTGCWIPDPSVIVSCYAGIVLARPETEAEQVEDMTTKIQPSNYRYLTTTSLFTKNLDKKIGIRYPVPYPATGF